MRFIEFNLIVPFLSQHNDNNNRINKWKKNEFGIRVEMKEGGRKQLIEFIPFVINSNKILLFFVRNRSFNRIKSKPFTA